MAISLISITDSVIDGDKKRVEDLVQRAIDENINRREILNALIKGIHDIGEKWTRLEVFIPDVMIATDVMKAGMGLLAPHLKKGEDWVPLGRVVLGTVKGDIHDIGKNIVGSMLSSSGFDVYDIGVDKPAITFIEKAKEVNADIIAISALLTTTMKGQQDIVELLTSMGSRNCLRKQHSFFTFAELLLDVGKRHWKIEAKSLLSKIISDNFWKKIGPSFDLC